MSSYRERALERTIYEEMQDLASGKYSIKSKYDNLSTTELIKEIENKDTEIHALQSNVAILNSKLWSQKQINIGLGLAYAMLLLCIGVKIFLAKYKAKIRKDLIKELEDK